MALPVVALLTYRPVSGDSGGGAYVLRLPGIAGDGASGSTFDPGVSASGVPYCRFLPGASAPAVLPPAPSPPAPPPLPEPVNSPVAAEVTQDQLAVFHSFRDAVEAKYVDPAFNGVDLDALGLEYEQRIQAGLSGAGFAQLMKLFIAEFGDGHSYYQTAAEVQEEADRLANGESFVGIGASIAPLEDGTGSVIYVLPGGPADLAGIRPHDHLVSVDGGPIRLADGTIATRGEPGTAVTVQLRRGGGPVFSLSLVRAAFTAPAPVGSCLVAGTRIGYLFLPTFFDTTIDAQVRAALQALMAGGPLTGLIIDDRMNSGGLDSEAKGVLGFLTSGNHGAYVSRSGSTPFIIQGEPIGNSQSVPVVVLVGERTASFGEVFAGVLAVSGRATIVGVTTGGNVELLNAITFDDGSRVWLAQSTFQPAGMPPGVWESSGIVPDVTVHGLWHEFTEVDDPGLARAIEVLLD